MKTNNKSKTQKRRQSGFVLRRLVFLSCFLLASLSVIYAQTKAITGRVVDEVSEPLIGVSVSIINTSVGTLTDADGRFTIQTSVGQELQFSFLGMKTQKVEVRSQNHYDIIMKEDAQLLKETVVIGYGSAKKMDLTGSIVRVASTEIANRPAANPAALIQGKVSGVQVLNSGVPGQDPEIRIRGTNSINGYKPLYVVDGLWMDNVNHINPADIEAMDILKDPSSLAIFGNRGANGVIIITTKRVDRGQTVVNINSSLGFRNIHDRIKVTNATDFIELYNEQSRNQGETPFDFSLWQADTDWQDEVLQSGFVTNNNISITGSNEKSRFYLGVGYSEEEGSIKYEKYSRVTFNLNSDYQVYKFLKVGYQVNAARTLPSDSKSISGAVKAAPITPVSSSDYIDPVTGMHEFLYHATPPFQSAQVSNPMIDIEGRKRHNLGTNYRAGGSIFGEVDLLKYFKFKATFSAEYQSNESRKFSPMTAVYNPILPFNERKEQVTKSESVSQTKRTQLNTQADYILSFENKFGDHSITATAGITTTYADISSITAGRSQYITDIQFSIPNNNPDKWWISSIGEKSMTNSGEQHRKFQMSYLTRALYNYKSRYLLNASFRRDGSSVFRGAGNTWDNFYAFGGGWIATEEAFMQDQKVLDFLKVKASYGVLGTQNTGEGGEYPSYPGLSAGGSAIFGDYEIPNYGASYRYQSGLGWEKTHAFEVGVETAWLNQRLRFEPTFYRKNTKDIIVMTPPFAGAQNSLGNEGEVRNQGFEFTASWNDKIGDFSYGLSVNLTTVNNKILKLGYGSNWELFKNIARTTPGQTIAHFYGYKVDGVYQNIEHIYQSPENTLGTPQPGDLMFKDLDGDGKITPKDRTIIGKPTPDFFYGMTLNLGYKGFDLSVDMMGVYGNEIYRTWDRHTYAQLNFLGARKGRWNGEGTSNWEPILDRQRALNTQVSNYFIEDASFIRIRNIQLGYTFSPLLLQKIHFKALRVFANVENPITWKKNTGYTPEIGGNALESGFDNGTYPIPAIYTFGINLSF